MVDVVTPQIRSAAQKAQQQVSQQQKQLDTQRSQLERQRGQLTSAQAVRTLSREARAQQTRQLGSAQQQVQQQTQQLQTASKELERIRNLPTAQELISQSRSQLQSDLKIARKAIRDKSIAVASLPKSVQDAVQQIREGQSDAAIIKRAQEQLGQTLTPVGRLCCNLSSNSLGICVKDNCLNSLGRLCCKDISVGVIPLAKSKISCLAFGVKV